MLAAIYVLGILLPSLVLLGLLWSTLSERHELALEKRTLERSEAVQKLRRGVDLEIELQRSMDRGLVKTGRGPLRFREDGVLLPYEEEALQTQLQEDVLLLDSPAWFDAVREEQRGAYTVAVLHYRRALAEKQGSASTATRIELAIARALHRAGRREESLAALTVIAARRLSPWEAWECARLRWLALGESGSAAERQSALDAAWARLREMRSELGLLEYLTLAEPLGIDVQPARPLELYRFLVSQRKRWAADPETVLVWTKAPFSPVVFMLMAPSVTEPAERAIRMVARSSILDATLDRVPGLLRVFDHGEGTAGPPLRVELEPLGMTLTFHEREPLPATFWGDPTARVLLGLGCGMLLVLALGLWVSLRAVAKESRLSLMRADFISSVSHELKTPLTSLRLYSDLLAAPTADAGKTREYQERISEETRKLTQLVANVLDASRIERGREYHMERMDLGRLAGETMRSFEARANANGVTLEARGCVEDCWIEGDAEALGQVLSNLLDNAIKHGGKSIRVEFAKTQNGIELRVCDDGPGIPRAQRARLFEPYERGTEHGPGQAPGSGLGLAIALDVIQAHAGATIDVEDRSEGGCCMRLCFRATDETSGSEA